MSDRFGELLRRELKKRGISPSGLADISGIPRSTVSSILTGNRKPGPKAWAQIQAALKLPPEDANRLWMEAKEASQRLAAVCEVSATLSPINLDHPAVAKLVADYFDEKIQSVRWPQRGFVLVEVDPGPVRSYIGLPLPASAGKVIPDEQQIAGAYDLVINCSGGGCITVAVRGFQIIAVKFQEGAPIPAPDNLPEVIKAGGVVFLPAAITKVTDLPREFR